MLADFLFFDDDDLILPKHIAQLVAELEVHSELVAAYSKVKCINERGESLQDILGNLTLNMPNIGQFYFNPLSSI